jgi:hypothetical protein
MTQRELNRNVAAATGESVREIARRGFVPLSPIPVEREPEDFILDWDAYDLERNVALVDQPQSELSQKGAEALCS